MALKASCPGCGKVIKGGDDWAGRTAQCPGCKSLIVFPQLDAVAATGPPPLPPAMLAAIHSPTDPLEGFEEFIALAEAGNRAASPPNAAPQVTPNLVPIKYQYQMVQIPPTIVVAQSKGNDAADFLQGVVNRYADNGWEFYRVDDIGVHVAPGCLGMLLGGRAETHQYHVITFRRPRND